MWKEITRFSHLNIFFFPVRIINTIKECSSRKRLFILGWIDKFRPHSNGPLIYVSLEIHIYRKYFSNICDVLKWSFTCFVLINSAFRIQKNHLFSLIQFSLVRFKIQLFGYNFQPLRDQRVYLYTTFIL